MIILNILHNKYPYFATLTEINNIFIPNSTNFNIREFCDEKLKFYDDMLKLFFDKLNNLDNSEYTEEMLLLLLNTVANLIMYQPFYDGNSRTAKLFMNILLNRLGYDFSYDSNSLIIPTFYSGEEKCGVEDLKKFKNNVKLKKR